MIFFSIITPTYKRYEHLLRTVGSVLKQSYSNFEMIIINDSPDDLKYAKIENEINDSRIKYFKNEKNMGVNFSRNRALDLVTNKSNWVIFLDDDDYLSPDTLFNFVNLINNHPKNHWFITNRILNTGKPLTTAPITDTEYSYSWDYLITKKIKGDATHCIKRKTVDSVKFSNLIKQAEEWIFFYQIGIKEKIFYSNHNSTITDGYDTEKGLNFRKRSKRERSNSLIKICKEALEKKFFWYPSFILYVFIRFLFILIK